MKRLSGVFNGAVCLAGAAMAQLSMQQRVDDFQALTAILNRNYAPYEWKRQVFGFDMLDTARWLDRVRAAKSDTEFYTICIEYIGNLNDANTFLLLPSDFEAYLGFTTDLYDGKAIVEFIDRSQLPSARYNIALGDELVSIDGRTVEALVVEFYKNAIEGNPQAARRLAADGLTYRPQVFFPDAGDLGANARVEIRKADGSLVTLTLPWVKTGTPMRVGPVPDFTAAEERPKVSKLDEVLEMVNRIPADRRAQRWPAASRAGREEESLPEAQATGALAPAFALPEGFQRRAGGARVDAVYSGSYMSEGKRIGFLRLPVISTSAAFLNQLDAELTWLQANTDVLVLDVMSNRGSACASERAAARFIGRTFLQPGYEVRASYTNLVGWEQTLEFALEAGADQTTLAWLRVILGDLRKAFAENRGRTGPLPFCGPTMDRPPATDREGNIIAYTKPILLVTNEFSTDYFAAALKDAGRAKQFGTGTRGLEGFGRRVGGLAFSEMQLSVKDAMMVRAAPVVSAGYPETAYVENVGVQPEFVEEFMTLENLRQRGAPFVSAFTKAALSLLP